MFKTVLLGYIAKVVTIQWWDCFHADGEDIKTRGELISKHQIIIAIKTQITDEVSVFPNNTGLLAATGRSLMKSSAVTFQRCFKTTERDSQRLLIKQ